MERLIKFRSRGKKNVIAFVSSELINNVPNAELSYKSEYSVQHNTNSFRLLT